MPDARILVGAIGAAHGVRGLVKLISFTEDPAAIVRYGELSDAAGARRFRVALVGGGAPAAAAAGAGQRGARLIAGIEGVADRNAAEALAGTELYVDRAQLPRPADPEDYYLADLVGLAAFDTGGRALGRVVAVHDYGAGASLEIAPEQAAAPTSRRGKPRAAAGAMLVPFTRAAVPNVDLASGRITVDPPAEIEVPPEGHAARAGMDAEAAP
ncbi:MAG: 16S rRNA processing protein RimM [Alphaproteobacteria bacterium]|nr:16S rRNA processing protein RimM [Alphaproteobacteria bacterium]